LDVIWIILGTGVTNANKSLRIKAVVKVDFRSKVLNRSARYRKSIMIMTFQTGVCGLHTLHVIFGAIKAIYS
jgi:hypothetical protein